MTTTPTTSALAEALARLLHSAMVGCKYDDERAVYEPDFDACIDHGLDARVLLSRGVQFDPALPDHILVERAAWDRLTRIEQAAARSAHLGASADVGGPTDRALDDLRAALAPTQPDAAQEPKP